MYDNLSEFRRAWERLLQRPLHTPKLEPVT
jgi:hypothetical protein